MNMVKVKVSELTGVQLDWAVTIAEGHQAEIAMDGKGPFCVRTIRLPNSTVIGPFSPSQHWSDGGPIIEREHMLVAGITFGDGSPYIGNWEAALPGKDELYGPTPLIATMRAFVASKLGDIVEVPEVAE